MLTDEEIKKLVDEATIAREHSLVIRTPHKIGASVLTDTGEVFGAGNIEGVIFGLGICAERNAINHAVSHGLYTIKALAVVDSELLYPCGACLQYLLQFHQISDQDVDIVIADLSGNKKQLSLLDFFPNGYLTKNHRKELEKYHL